VMGVDGLGGGDDGVVGCGREASSDVSSIASVRYHCGGWSEEVNSCILILSYMVYL
jgi:hypothetical protein